MKVTDWKRLARQLVPAGESWEFRGSLLYRRPFDWVLHGVLGESSAFDRGVYVWRVVMPLFVPDVRVNLSWSERVGGPAGKYAPDDPALPSAVREAMRTAGDPLALLVATDPGRNRAAHEIRGYALLLQGEHTEAAAALEAATAGAVGPAWEQEIVDRARLNVGAMRAGDPGAVLKRLARWRDGTCAAMGLRQ